MNIKHTIGKMSNGKFLLLLGSVLGILLGALIIHTVFFKETPEQKSAREIVEATERQEAAAKKELVNLLPKWKRSEEEFVATTGYRISYLLEKQYTTSESVQAVLHESGRSASGLLRVAESGLYVSTLYRVRAKMSWTSEMGFASLLATIQKWDPDGGDHKIVEELLAKP
jgi:hypothetical protein